MKATRYQPIIVPALLMLAEFHCVEIPPINTYNPMANNIIVAIVQPQLHWHFADLLDVLAAMFSNLR